MLVSSGTWQCLMRCRDWRYINCVQQGLLYHPNFALIKDSFCLASKFAGLWEICLWISKSIAQFTLMLCSRHNPQLRRALLSLPLRNLGSLPLWDHRAYLYMIIGKDNYSCNHIYPYIYQSWWRRRYTRVTSRNRWAKFQVSVFICYFYIPFDALRGAAPCSLSS